MLPVLRKLPLPVTGLTLGLATLGNLLAPYGWPIKAVCGILSAGIWLLFVMKLLFCRSQVADILRNPVPLSVFPTFTMTLMVLCTYVEPFAGMAARVLWCCAAAGQVVIMAVFYRRSFRRVPGFTFDSVLPSWLILSVGIAVVGVTGASMGMRVTAQAAVVVGIIMLCIHMPLTILRRVRKGPLPEHLQPSAAIITSPTSLCIAAYMNAFETPNIAFLIVISSVAAVFYIVTTVRLFWLLRTKFYPTYVSFTFPYAISSVAATATAAALSDAGYTYLTYAPLVTQVIATILVSYVLVRYTMFMLTDDKKHRDEAAKLSAVEPAE